MRWEAKKDSKKSGKENNRLQEINGRGGQGMRLFLGFEGNV